MQQLKQKQPTKLRKVEDFVIERRPQAHANHGGGEGWAVSYADMLMVLLSFFVMFFSLKEENPETVHQELAKIAMSMRGLAKDDKVPEAAVEVAKENGKDYSDIAQAMKMDGVTVINERSQVTVTLDEDSYGSAAYKPTASISSKVENILQRLEPFKNEIQIMIVGHTDTRPLRPRNEFLKDNFDLSSLRALNVLKFVIAKGFPENHASARAASSFDREARSVSIVVQHIDAVPASTPEKKESL